MSILKLHHPESFTEGYQLAQFPLNPSVKTWVEKEEWTALDAHFKSLTQPGQPLFLFLQKFHEFQAIEFIISVRDSKNEWEEDGIWHDDGTRVFAFSLSLTLNAPSIEGGKLGIRRKGEESFLSIPTPDYGTMILFLTGIHGYEHKTHQVTSGKRIIIAGWCS